MLAQHYIWRHFIMTCQIFLFFNKIFSCSLIYLSHFGLQLQLEFIKCLLTNSAVLLYSCDYCFDGKQQKVKMPKLLAISVQQFLLAHQCIIHLVYKFRKLHQKEIREDCYQGLGHYWSCPSSSPLTSECNYKTNEWSGKVSFIHSFIGYILSVSPWTELPLTTINHQHIVVAIKYLTTTQQDPSVEFSQY